MPTAGGRRCRLSRMALADGTRRDLDLPDALASPEAQRAGERGVVRLAQLTGREKSRVSRALKALAEEGVVKRDPGTLGYRLGRPLFSLVARTAASGRRAGDARTWPPSSKRPSTSASSRPAATVTPASARSSRRDSSGCRPRSGTSAAGPAAALDASAGSGSQLGRAPETAVHHPVHLTSLHSGWSAAPSREGAVATSAGGPRADGPDRLGA